MPSFKPSLPLSKIIPSVLELSSYQEIKQARHHDNTLSLMEMTGTVYSFIRNVTYVTCFLLPELSKIHYLTLSRTSCCSKEYMKVYRKQPVIYDAALYPSVCIIISLQLHTRQRRKRPKKMFESENFNQKLILGGLAI